MKQVIRVVVLVGLLLSLSVSSRISADSGNIDSPYYQVTTSTLDSGETIEEIIINGPPMPLSGELQPTVSLAGPYQQGSRTVLTSVPGFNWSYGCSATSAAMIAGYYDRNGYPNMYAGTTHGGVMPMDNSYWATSTDSCGAMRNNCPLSATYQGGDARAIRGHVDDYWYCYGSSNADPFYGNWTEHTKGDCTGDYMYTNQTSNYNVSDGATRFWSYSSATPMLCDTLENSSDPTHWVDGTLGLRNFYESRGYTVSDCYYQKTDNQYTGGFSFTDFQAQIDAGRPVMVHVEGHTMVGFGYDSSSNEIYLRDTWDYDAHTMTWGGSYDTMALVGVSIVTLDPTGYNSAQTGAWNATSTWSGSTVPGASDNVTIKTGHTVTLGGNVQCENLAIEYGATLVIPDGYTLTVEDTFSNNGTIQQTLNVPSGSTTSFLQITDTSTNAKYYGVDITPTSTGLGSTTVAIKGNQSEGCTSVTTDPLLNRCFEITPASQQAATIRFWYDEDERNDQDASALAVWHHDGGTSWTKVGTYTYSESSTDCQSGDGQACWVEASGISGYSVFDIGSSVETPTATTVQALAAPSQLRNIAYLVATGAVAAILVVGFSRKRRSKGL